MRLDPIGEATRRSLALCGAKDVTEGVAKVQVKVEF